MAEQRAVEQAMLNLLAEAADDELGSDSKNMYFPILNLVVFNL